MRLVGNFLNGDYFENIAQLANTPKLEQISLAVAYVKSAERVLDIAKNQGVPVSLYALADGGSFPSIPVMRRFLEGPTSWQLFLTRSFYHPKIVWFRGVGAYIGSANLTQEGWWDDLECGVWFSQDELLRENLDEQLPTMFDVIASRSTPASMEHIEAYERLASSRRRIADEADRKFKELVDKELSSIRGADKPIRPTKPKGGAAKQRFMEEWQNGLTLLRKMTALVRDRPWPAWVSKNSHPSIVQDQATEYWYGREVRHSGEALVTVGELYEQNKRDPDSALERVFSEWAQFEGDEKWAFYINDGPQRTNELLAANRIPDLDETTLAEVMHNTHASREHARQMRKRDLGDEGQETPSEERTRLYARYLLAQRSEGDKDVKEVLAYVLWGDNTTPDVAERIWDAAHESTWKIPHLGRSILGELVGYARPDEYPPRNGRVSKTLTALGFQGIRY